MLSCRNKSIIQYLCLFSVLYNTKLFYCTENYFVSLENSENLIVFENSTDHGEKLLRTDLKIVVICINVPSNVFFLVCNRTYIFKHTYMLMVCTINIIIIGTCIYHYDRIFIVIEFHLCVTLINLLSSRAGLYGQNIFICL